MSAMGLPACLSTRKILIISSNTQTTFLLRTHITLQLMPCQWRRSVPPTPWTRLFLPFSIQSVKSMPSVEAVVEGGVVTGGEATEVEAVVVQLAAAVSHSLSSHNKGQGNTRGPSTLTCPQESGQGAKCISGGGAKQIFVLSHLPVLGEIFSSQNPQNEGPTNSVN